MGASSGGLHGYSAGKGLRVFTNTSILDFTQRVSPALSTYGSAKGTVGPLWSLEEIVCVKVGNREKGKMCYSIATLPPSI